MPPFFGVWGQVGLHEPTFSCTILEKDGKSIKKFLFLVGILIPCIVIICSYSCIYWTVRRQRKRIDRHSAISAGPKNGSKKNSNISNRNSCRIREREDSRLTAMMLTIFVCFLVCFLPLMLVNVTDDKNKYPWLHIFASVFAWAASVINPFIYAASNRTYRVAYYKLFGLLKFWGQPLSPMISKSFVPSRCSKDQSNMSAAVTTPATMGAVVVQQKSATSVTAFNSDKLLLPV